MLQIQNTIVSFDVLTKRFACNLDCCKGACCVEGDAGAPLLEEEVKEIEAVLPVIWDMLSEQAQEIIKQNGIAYRDPEGELVTQIVNGKDCVFAFHENGCCYCAIERAARQGKCSFLKPVSCHLYPIRINKLSGGMFAINYHRWDICHSAMKQGEKNGIPLYKYLKEPLVRRFGQEWYAELELTVSEMQKQHII
ncbi:MAG: DUF3109 family protein [Bacteroidaceae bacterium]|nr:DUF3109 family protein [Bacteroidaceae bacterium]